ncbi:MAG: ROK family protein [Candidatus Acetothermia bacterium]
MHPKESRLRYNNSHLVNKASVFESLSFDSPATIKQVAGSTRLSTPTVTKALSHLQEIGLVTEKGRKDQPKGRKPTLFGLSEGYYWLGIDLEIPDLRIAVYDLAKRLIKSKKDFVCVDEQDGEVEKYLPGSVIDKVKGFLQAQDISVSSILGEGVGVPGMVSEGTFKPFSRLKNPPSIPLKEPLEKKLDIPTVIGNDVDLELLAELDRRSLLEEPGVVAVYLAARPSKATHNSVRIGGSVFHDGTILQGAMGSANEFGHTSVSRGDHGELKCNCGNPKCLETYVNQKISGAPAGRLPEEVVEVLTDKLKDLIFLYNPSLLIVDLLAFPQLSSPVLEGINQFIELRHGHLDFDRPEVVTPGDSEMACARGACIKSFQNMAVNPERYPILSQDS